MGDDSLIIAAERASVELLPFVGAPGVVGFVFEQASVLAHLAVVLREKGVPAIALDDPALFASLRSGATVTVDAFTASLPKAERIVASEDL